MAFPEGAISLDTFARPSNGLGDNWDTVSGYQGLHIINDNSAAATNGQTGFDYWNVTAYPAHQEVYAVVETAGSDIWLGFRLQTPSTSPDGYRVECRHTGSAVYAYLVRVSTSVAIGSPLTLGITALAAGDAVGVDANGSTITLYYRASGGSWTSMGSWTDSAVSAAGYIGLGIGGWPSQVYVATVTGGVYYTSTFTAPTVVTQPTWTAINTGLPTHTDSNIYISRFFLDTSDPGKYQYAHIIQGTTNSLYRRVSGGDWALSIDIDTALTLAGVGPRDTFNDPIMRAGANRTTGALFLACTYGGATSGRRDIRILTSTDHGANWSYVGTTGINGYYGFDDPYISIGARHYLYAALGATTALITSANSGSTWSKLSEDVQKIGLLVGVSDALPTRPYSRYNPTGAHSVGVHVADTSATLPVILPASTAPLDLQLYGTSTNPGGFGGIWLSPYNANLQRILRRKDPADTMQALYETTDAWTTATKIADLTVATSLKYTQILTVRDSLALHDWTLLGFRPLSDVLAQFHSVYALDLDNSSTPVGKAGASPGVSPYTDSIPWTKGGAINEGVRVVY